MLEAHLCQTQEGTMYKIKTSLNYLEYKRITNTKEAEKKNQAKTHKRS